MHYLSTKRDIKAEAEAEAITGTLNTILKPTLVNYLKYGPKDFKLCLQITIDKELGKIDWQLSTLNIRFS